MLAWHLGKRDEINTCRFIMKVREATSSKCVLISTDGWPAYEYAIDIGLSDCASYGRLIKVNYPNWVEAVFGDPDIDEIETTYIERFNGTLRQWCKRFSRKTYAFSKKWEKLEAALALAFTAHNYRRVHATLRVTPVMAAGLTGHPWTMNELLEEACL